MATIKQAMKNAARERDLVLTDVMIHKVYKLNDEGLWGMKFFDRTFAHWCVNNKRVF